MGKAPRTRELARGGGGDEPKVMFSRTLDRASWGNTTLLRGDPAREVRTLKHFGNGNAELRAAGVVARRHPTRAPSSGPRRLRGPPIRLGIMSAATAALASARPAAVHAVARNPA